MMTGHSALVFDSSATSSERSLTTTDVLVDSYSVLQFDVSYRMYTIMLIKSIFYLSF